MADDLDFTKEDTLEFRGISKIDLDRDGTRYLCRSYSEDCDECGVEIHWFQWVKCKAGMHGPGRPLTRRRFSRCCDCVAAHHRVKIALAKEEELKTWLDQHGMGVTPVGLKVELPLGIPWESLVKH